jgi:hypothetical protein
MPKGGYGVQSKPKARPMRTRLYPGIALATAIVFAAVLAAAPTSLAAQKNRTVATKKVAKKYRPVPVTMARPRTRITVTRRSFLDPGREVIPGSQHEFTDYAHPPGYSPTSVIDNTAFNRRSALPGPFDLPGRGNPYPWNPCVGC